MAGVTAQERADAIRDRRNTITIDPAQVRTSVVFHASSALYDCTQLEMASGEGMQVHKKWPRLSRGEELLWQVLAWVNGQGDRPTDADLVEHLDADNLAAVTKTIERAAR